MTRMIPSSMMAHSSTDHLQSHNSLPPQIKSMIPQLSPSWTLHHLIGAFSSHLSNNLLLSTSMIAFLISLKQHEFLLVIGSVKRVPKPSSSSLHSLSRQIESTSLHRASATHCLYPYLLLSSKTLTSSPRPCTPL